MIWRRNALRLYRALLFAYPAEFRHEYGEEMEHLFASRFGEEPQVRLWLEVLADVMITAPREHLEILAADLRHSARLLVKAPAFTFVALFAIALGVGAATAVFSLINAVLIRSMPYGDADRLVYMWAPDPSLEGVPREMVPPFVDLFAWREMSRSFSEIT